MADLARIRDLEHDGNEYVPAIAPLGADPDHCRTCSLVAAAVSPFLAAMMTRNQEAIGSRDSAAQVVPILVDGAMVDQLNRRQACPHDPDDREP